MPGDLAELIGPAAERVENRSLLLDKFIFHKKWPEATDDRGREVKWDEAARWSFMRIADGAAQLLKKDAGDKRRKADGRNVEPQNRDRYNAEAGIADSLENIRWDGKDLADLRARHTRRFLGLFRSAYGDRAAITIGQLEGRLAINLADSLIQNAGICLDRLFGLPYIPGSAIKGVCRHAALEELRNANESDKPTILCALCAVFGTAENDFAKGDLRAYRALKPGKDTDQKGAISFLPAYPANAARIVVDLTNVHYPDYYRTGQERDQRNENPRPNPFPAVEVGAQFAFCLVLNGINNDPALLTHARRWLEAALAVRGLGAKTASGYGWFSLRPEVLDQLFAEEAREAEAVKKKAEAELAKAEAAAKEAARKAALTPEDAAADELLNVNEEAFATFAKQLAAQDEIRQRAFIHLLRNHKDKRDRWKTWKKKKPDLAKSISDVCAKLNLPPLP
jgi:CRISPR type III-B/RAMP module RAMP protein Cmr6